MTTRDLPKRYTYYGVNIEDMTREQLIEALKYATEEIHRLYEWRAEDGKFQADLMRLVGRE